MNGETNSQLAPAQTGEQPPPAGVVARQDAEMSPDAVEEFLAEYDEIRRTRIATHVRLSGARFAIATTVLNRSGEAVASVTLVGPTSDLKPRMEQLARVLLRRVDSWSQRSMTPREAI